VLDVAPGVALGIALGVALGVVLGIALEPASSAVCGPAPAPVLASPMS
jgi:hypothetical protein